MYVLKYSCWQYCNLLLIHAASNAGPEMIRLLMMLALPALTGACIPTKHPEPGIPATTTTTTTPGYLTICIRY